MQLNTSVASTIVSRVTYTTTAFSSTCVVGAPYQGAMRQLAADRWNYMYPS